MKKTVVALVVAALAAACSTSPCEKYAKLEWKCGNYPEAEKDLTLKLAEGMCEAARADTSEETRMMREAFKVEMECAQSAKDCSEYDACKASNAEMSDGPF